MARTHNPGRGGAAKTAPPDGGHAGTPHSDVANARRADEGDSTRRETLARIAREHPAEKGWYFANGVDVRHDMNLYVDTGQTLCEACVRLIEQLLARSPAMRDTPQDEREALPEHEAVHDTPSCCAWCAARIAYALTDEGVDEELIHYQQHPPGASGTLAPDDAYALGAMADALPEHPRSPEIRTLIDNTLDTANLVSDTLAETTRKQAERKAKDSDPAKHFY